MDASLQAQLNAYKKHAVSLPSLQKQKDAEKSKSAFSAFNRQASARSRYSTGPTQLTEGQQQHRAQIVKGLITHLREAHKKGDCHALTLNEICEEVNQHTLTETQKLWIEETAFQNHPKITVVKSERGLKFKFKPKFKIKDRKSLLAVLKDRHENRLGGVNFEDIDESMAKADRAVQKLKDANKIFEVVTKEQRKKRMIFYRKIF